jgi:hypothetical protein
MEETRTIRGLSNWFMSSMVHFMDKKWGKSAEICVIRVIYVLFLHSSQLGLLRFTHHTFQETNVTANTGVKLLLLITLFIAGFLTQTDAESSRSIKPFFELRQQYEDNIFQVPTENEPQKDFATHLWTGVDFSARFDEKTRLSARYEAAPRRFADFAEKNRHDHLLSLLLRRRLSSNLTFLTVGNIGLRFQPNDAIHEYFKQDITGQVQIRWNPLWSSQFGVQFRNKYFPNNKNGTYTSFMVEGKLRRRIGSVSQVRGGLSLRRYDGAIDPRVLVSELNRDMEGVRQTTSLSFESMLFGRVLTDLRYQFEIDIATRELQRYERFSREPEQVGEFEDDDDDDDDADFNFTNHRVATIFVWRLAKSSSVSLSARHHFKFYRDWIVPQTDKKRRDNLTLLRLGFKQNLIEGLSARLEYVLEKNNSNDLTQKYTNNAYSVRLQYAF